jgi:small-conductance mechanosensitive channel
MRFLNTSTSLFVTVILIGLSISNVSAQTSEVKKVDDTQLVQLYELQLENSEDTFLQKRINEEREDIRNTIEEELNILVAIPANEEKIDDSGELSKAMDRQRNLIQALQERLRERKIDLDLLVAEEQKFYLQDVAFFGTGVIADFRTTKSHQGLLAKKAVLEERITLIESLIPHQQERLSRLVVDQRRQQFGSLIDLGMYAGIILLILLIERFIRRLLLVRIPNRSVRYSVIKFFSGGTYTLIFLWIFGAVYSKNPGILASFAIVGAGIAIAMQDIIKDIVGWVVIHQSQLFSQGNRVSIGQKTGEVIDIGLLHTKVLEIGIPPDGVLEHTGKVLSIPNAKILTETLNNYHTTSDFVKAEMRFAITFESNWRKAEELLTQILQTETQEYATRDQRQQSMRTRTMYVPYDPGVSHVFKNIAADGVEFQLRFTVPVGMYRTVVSMLSDKILEAFAAESDIELAYKTTRYFKRGEE